MTKKLAWIEIERGILASVWSEQGLYELTFPYPSQQEARTHLTTSGLSEAALAPAQQEWLKRLTNQLRQFFDGKPVAFSIGETLNADTAVHANRTPIVVPCHRVIGSDGSLTGFGGGLTLKQELLGLEQKQSE